MVELMNRYSVLKEKEEEEIKQTEEIREDSMLLDGFREEEHRLKEREDEEREEENREELPEIRESEEFTHGKKSPFFRETIISLKKEEKEEKVQEDDSQTEEVKRDENRRKNIKH